MSYVIPSIQQLRQRAGCVSSSRDTARPNRARTARRGGRDARPDRRRDRHRPTSLPRLKRPCRPASTPTARRRSDRVINATGVILHTNLGRAPLGDAAAARVADLATGYTNLEYDVDARRTRPPRRPRRAAACRLTGAEAAVVVNNNAAAALVVLAALAAGREVLISRGELIEIGGGFRVPDVLAQSGARLREVGTTNRTRVADYAAAISDRTALILRVHPSNFRIEGFTERPALDALVALGRRFNVPVVEDQGSGYLGFAPDGRGAPRRARRPGQLSAGADAVLFSGDKLLGGPQAGIIVGAAEAVARIRRHPLMRAIRVDKMTYRRARGDARRVSWPDAPETSRSRP